MTSQSLFGFDSSPATIQELSEEMSGVVKVVICLLWTLTVASTTNFNLSAIFPFLPSFGKFGRLRKAEPAATNICIYSSDPDKFQPKCFLCPNDAYPNIMQACSGVVGSGTPGNVTHRQASCIERNCAINYPTSGNDIYGIRVGRQMPENSSLVLPSGEDDASLPDSSASEENDDSQEEAAPIDTGESTVTLAATDDDDDDKALAATDDDDDDKAA